MQIRIFLANDGGQTANLIAEPAGQDGTHEITWAVFNARGRRITWRTWAKEQDETAGFVRRSLDRLEPQGWRISRGAPALTGLELVGR